MSDLADRLDRLPRGLRWALFLPVGIVCSLIAETLVHAAFGLASGPYRTVPGLAENLVTAFVAAATVTVFPAVVSPRPWPVGIAMFAGDLVLRVAPVAYLVLTTPYLQPRAGSLAPLIAAHLAGGGLGLCLVAYWERARGRRQAP